MISPATPWRSGTASYTTDAWTFSDFFGNESSWTVTDSTGATLWAGRLRVCNTYVASACIPPGCHTLTVEDSGGDGLALGGSLLLQNAAGDTLALIPHGTNFGGSIAFDVCATTPAIYNPVNAPGRATTTTLRRGRFQGAPTNYSPAATLETRRVPS